MLLEVMTKPQIFIQVCRLGHYFNLRFEDLGYRCGISVTTVTVRLFQKWIDLMFVNMKFLVKWPQQDVGFLNMPQIFKDLYPRT